MNQNAASFFVDRHVECGRAEAVAVLCAGRQLSYRDLANAVNQVGHYLHRMSVRPEQRVVLLLHDCPEFLYFFMATLKIGAVAVPINTFCSSDLLAYYLNDTRAPVLVTHKAYTEKVLALADEAVPFLERVLYIEDMEWKSEGTTLQPVPVHGDDSAFWLYTSGSAGAQKGVVHRHASMVICAQNYGRHVLCICEDDRCYSTSKLFSAYGLGNSIIFPFSVGASCVLHGGRNDPDTVVSLIRQFKPTLFFSAPTLYDQLLACSKINRELFADVRMCVSAGEYLSEIIFDAWLARTGKIAYDGIGSTEAMHIFCSNRPGAYQRGTSGTPVDGYDLRIVNERGEPLGPTEIGCLHIRGKTLGKAYWNKYDTSQCAFLGEWLMTGDIYQQMENGYFKYIGRQEDVFKSSGLWVSPVEIEQLLLSHPDIKEAGVIGVMNSRGLFVAKAFVVPKIISSERGDTTLMRGIHSYLEGCLSRYKIPSAIKILPVLPKTATGKIARAELRQIHCEESGVFDSNTTLQHLEGSGNERN